MAQFVTEPSIFGEPGREASGHLTLGALRARLLLVLLALALASDAAAAEVSFRRDVAPILRDHCLACHNAQSAEGSYRVDSYQQMLLAGDSGETPIEKGKKSASELLRRLTCDESQRMPADGDPLPPDQIAKIAAWIEAGAEFDGTDAELPLSQVIPVAHPDPPTAYPMPVPAAAVCFSPAGNHIIVGGYHELLVWDVETLQLVGRIPNLGQRSYAAVPSPNAEDSRIAVACGEPGRSGEVRLVDLASGDVRLLSADAQDVVTTVAWSPNAKQIAAGSFDRNVRVFDALSGDLVHTLASHADAIYSVAFSADGSRLVSTARDGTVKVFDTRSGQLEISYADHAAPVAAAVFSDDSQQVFSIGDDQQLHHWKIADGKSIGKTKLTGRPLRLAARAGRLAILCSDGSIQLVDATTRRVVGSLEGHQDWVISAAFDRQGTRLVSGGFDGEVRLWDVSGKTSNSWVAKP